MATSPDCMSIGAEVDSLESSTTAYEKLLFFSSRVSMPMLAERDIVMTNLSVCLSVTRWYCIKTNAHIVKLILSADRGMTWFS